MKGDRLHGSGNDWEWNITLLAPGSFKKQVCPNIILLSGGGAGLSGIFTGLPPL